MRSLRANGWGVGVTVTIHAFGGPFHGFLHVLGGYFFHVLGVLNLKPFIFHGCFGRVYRISYLDLVIWLIWEMLVIYSIHGWYGIENMSQRLNVWYVGFTYLFIDHTF